MGTQARLRAEEGGGFSLGLVLTPCLGGVSVAPSPPLSHPQHPPSLSLNHSDPAHLELVCFSILSSTVVISNQPICVSLSPRQWPTFLLISARPGRRKHRSAWRQRCCFGNLRCVCLTYIIYITLFTLDRYHKQTTNTV